ncbi:DUF192 domain-containing protein [Pseudofulvibacter geojedonensis]|uniref:DUF192 domain-containing protein n=1 Tax=Pseudofulvibacter geojedonensis TaxID=1123758 RepID=A0ABW3I5B3_9FLAO
MNYKSILISLLTVGTISCKKDTTTKNNVKPPEIVFKHEANLSILDSLKTTKIDLEIEIADNDFEHQTGLMYRKKMELNRGMLFVFDKSEMKSFYMKNTLIPLDIIFIDYNKQIINIVKEAKPLKEESIYSESPAYYVLEVNAGMSDKWNLNKGDYISFTKL